MNKDSVVIGMVAARAAEAEALLGKGTWRKEDGWPVLKRSLGRLRLVCVRSGPEGQSARAAADHLVGSRAALLLTVGACGGLDPLVRPGTLVATSAVLDLTGSAPANIADLYGLWAERLLAGLRHSGLKSVGGLLAAVAEPPASPEAKHTLFQQFGALAVDTISASVAHVAAIAGLPFATLAAVCDDARTVSPPGLPDLLGPDGRPGLWTIMRSAVTRPGLIRDLREAGPYYRAAITALRCAREPFFKACAAGLDLRF